MRKIHKKKWGNGGRTLLSVHSFREPKKLYATCSSQVSLSRCLFIILVPIQSSVSAVGTKCGGWDLDFMKNCTVARFCSAETNNFVHLFSANTLSMSNIASLPRVAISCRDPASSRPFGRRFQPQSRPVKPRRENDAIPGVGEWERHGRRA